MVHLHLTTTQTAQQHIHLNGSEVHAVQASEQRAGT